jgi:hypothetical protein
MALEMHNPGPLLTTDVSVGAILPDGETVLWITQTAPLKGVITRLRAKPATFSPSLQGVTWPAGVNGVQGAYLTYTWPGQAQQGTDHVLVGWTKPHRLADGRMDEGDILALTFVPLTFTRGVGELFSSAR